MKFRTYSIIAVHRETKRPLGVLFYGRYKRPGKTTLKLSADLMDVVHLDSRNLSSKKENFAHWKKLLRPMRRRFPQYEFKIIKNGPTQPIYPDWNNWWGNDLKTWSYRKKAITNAGATTIPFVINQNYRGTKQLAKGE